MADSEAEYADPENPYDIEEIRRQDIDEDTIPELRIRIAKRVGLNTNPSTRFSKRELNSIYAFMEGEFFIDKQNLGTPNTRPVDDLRAAIRTQIGKPYVTQWDTRPLRKAELTALCGILSAMEDQR